MKAALTTIAAVIALAASNGHAVEDNSLDIDMEPGANYATAAFRFWHPPEVKVLSGVAVLVPGSNGDGRPMAQEPFWQAFARKQRLALVGCYFKDRQHENMNIEEYARAQQGSGQALLDALGRFAVSTEHAEAARARLLLWGHSAGGEFNYEFACWKPERVQAFVVNKGGYYFTHLAPSATRQVPGLFFIGGRDEEFRILSIRGIVAINQRAGAVWKLVVLPEEGHEVGKTRDLAVELFEKVLGTPPGP